MDWSHLQYDEEFSSATWAPQVLEALQGLFTTENRAGHMWETVTLVSADLELDTEGTPFLLAIYDHAWWDRRIGLRRQLDHGPMSEVPGRTRAEALALDIAMYDLAEPLGSYWDLLVEDDNGVWWWGDGYPGLTP